MSLLPHQSNDAHPNAIRLREFKPQISQMGADKGRIKSSQNLRKSAQSAVKTLYGRSVEPMRNLSHSLAAPRPSLKAHTTRLWPRRQSPAANTPGMLVVYFSNSALMLLRVSRFDVGCRCP